MVSRDVPLAVESRPRVGLAPLRPARPAAHAGRPGCGRARHGGARGVAGARGGVGGERLGPHDPDRAGDFVHGVSAHPKRQQEGADLRLGRLTGHDDGEGRFGLLGGKAVCVGDLGEQGFEVVATGIGSDANGLFGALAMVFVDNASANDAATALKARIETGVFPTFSEDAPELTPWDEEIKGAEITVTGRTVTAQLRVTDPNRVQQKFILRGAFEEGVGFTSLMMFLIAHD